MTDIPKNSKDDLQRILKAILEIQAFAPIPGLAPAPTASEKLRDKLLKARSLDAYCKKSYIDCYNFCQQNKDYYATNGATKANKIPFTMYFFQDRINFCW